MRRLKVIALPLPGPTELEPVQAHHLEHVLRARVGQEVSLFDGSGNEQVARVESLGPVRVSPVGPPTHTRPVDPIHLVLSVLKHQAMDLALRMATEAGASVVHPVLMERTIARGDRGPRWERILVAASTQCGRADVPALMPVRSLDDTLNALGVPLLFGAPGAGRPEAAREAVGLVIGPAGGLSPREVDDLLQRGARPVGLGPHVLRAETAVAVALGLLRA